MYIKTSDIRDIHIACEAKIYIAASRIRGGVRYDHFSTRTGLQRRLEESTFCRRCLDRRDPFPVSVVPIDITVVETRRRGRRAIESIEPVSLGLRHDPMVADTEGEGAQGPEQTANGCRDESACSRVRCARPRDRRRRRLTESTPIIGVEPIFQQHQIGAVLSIAKIDSPEDEDGQEAAQPAHDDLESPPVVEAIAQPDHEHRDRARADQIRDQVDLQDIRTLQGDDDDGENDEHDRQADPPEIQRVAEEVVAAGGDHGGLQAVEGRRAQRHDHDQHDAHDPGRKLPEQEEKRNAPILRRVAGPGACPRGKQAPGSDERQDDGHGDRGNADADVQIFVGLGGEGAHPETGDEEVVGQDCDGQDVDQLPAQQARVQQSRRMDQGFVDMGLHADGDHSEDDEAHDHGSLDVVGYERHAETAQS